MESEKKDPDLLLTVERALRILSIFSEEKNEYTLQEISDALNIPKSMTFRTLYTLETMGYLVKDEKDKTYTLGFEIFRLGKIVGQSFSLAKIASPILEELNKKTGETVVLVVPDETMLRAVQIISIETAHPIRQDSNSISVGYLHCGATKKAILAHMEKAFVNEVIEQVGLPKITKNTMTDPSELKQELEKIRKQGYAVSCAEATPDVFSVAAPIFDHEEKIMGSVGINLPMYRLEDEKKFIKFAQLYGAKISKKLAYKV